MIIMNDVRSCCNLKSILYRNGAERSLPYSEENKKDNSIIRLSYSIYDEMLRTFKYSGQESAGIIGFKNTTITWVRKIDGTASEVSFTPNSDDLERAYYELEEGSFTGWGILHSHPAKEPISPSDIRFAREMLSCNNINILPMIILAGTELKIHIVTLEDCYEKSFVFV